MDQIPDNDNTVPLAPIPSAIAVVPAARRAPLSRRRRWLFRLMTVTVFPLFFLGLLELSLRTCGYGSPSRFFLAREVNGQQAYIENAAFCRQFFPKGLARAASACVLPAVKEPQAYRIFVLGESAANGYPDSSVCFARILAVMLRENYPGTRFEVVNTAMAAINSHVILPIARDCAAHEPDLFIVYMGNNEVVGPYGTAGVLGPFSSNLALIRASIFAKSLRTGQLIKNLLERNQANRSWNGMAMFANSQVRAVDPRMEAVYANFTQNLHDICRAGSAAKVILCTLGTNLKDSPPFASLPSAELPGAQAEPWKQIYEEGVQSQSAGKHTAAVESYRGAMALDDKFAELHFRLGTCLAALGKKDEAREHFIQARDLDTLRFRADSRINDAVRAVAAGWEKSGVCLIDIEKVFAEASPAGIPGDDLFYEHVHMNFAGNYLIARSLFQQIARILPAEITARGPNAAPLSEQACMERLAFTDWKRCNALEAVAKIMIEPPFTNQSDAAGRVQRIRRQFGEMRQRLKAGGLWQTAAVFRRALEHADDDYELRADFSEVLSAQGLYHEAETQLRRCLTLVPHHAGLYFQLGMALMKQKQYDEALACADAALLLDRERTEPLNLRGVIWMDMGKYAEAVSAFKEAAKFDPGDYRIYINLGQAFASNSQPDQAVSAWNTSLRLKPDNAQVHFKLSGVYHRQKIRHKEIEHLTEVLRLEPDFVNAHLALGMALFNTQQFADAAEHFRTALRLDPQLAAAHYGLAKSLLIAGSVKEATFHLEEAARLEPGNAEFQRALQEIRSKSKK